MFAPSASAAVSLHLPEHRPMNPKLTREEQLKRFEPNSLRLVCRQLYDETNGLELKLNHVVCRSAPNDEGIWGKDDETLSRFTRSIDSGLRLWAPYLKSVSLHPKSLTMFPNIEPGPSVTITQMARIGQFCAQNPHVEVKLHFETLDFGNSGPMLSETWITTIVLHAAISGRVINLPTPHNRAALLSTGWVDEWQLPASLPANLRVFPSTRNLGEGNFNYFRRILSGGMQEQQVEGWIEQIQKWYAQGLGQA